MAPKWQSNDVGSLGMQENLCEVPCLRAKVKDLNLIRKKKCMLKLLKSTKWIFYLWTYEEEKEIWISFCCCTLSRKGYGHSADACLVKNRRHWIWGRVYVGSSVSGLWCCGFHDHCGSWEVAQWLVCTLPLAATVKSVRGSKVKGKTNVATSCL